MITRTCIKSRKPFLFRFRRWEILKRQNYAKTGFYFLFRGCRMPYQLNGNCVTVVTAEGYSNQLSLADFQGF